MRVSKFLAPLLVIATIAACSDLFNNNDANTRTLNFTSTAADSSTVIFYGEL